MADSRSVTIINPLAGALHHYSRELRDVILSTGHDVALLETPEPSRGAGRLQWLVAYARLIREGSKREGLVVSTWPCLGWFDVFILTLLGGRASALVVHDPTPLVRAAGHGPIAKAIARRLNRVLVLCHSESAYDEVTAWLPHGRVSMLPHPVLTHTEGTIHPSASSATVRVLGQWKPSRDLRAMESLSRDPRFSHITFEAIGRGWPPIRGWRVRDEFVSEAEMDTLIDQSAAIVIPYNRFYQSGVAIRALEKIRPVVGPGNSSLRDIYGPHAQNLVKGAGWATALEAALAATHEQVYRQYAGYRETTLNAYSNFFASLQMRATLGEGR